MRAATRHDYSCKERSAMLVIAPPERGYRGGFITTPHGIVGFYDQTENNYTSLDVVFGGRNYSISWPRKFTDRRLKTLARRFAADVARVRSEHLSPLAPVELGPGMINPPPPAEGQV